MKLGGSASEILGGPSQRIEIDTERGEVSRVFLLETSKLLFELLCVRDRVEWQNWRLGNSTNQLAYDFSYQPESLIEMSQ